ncbi:methylmalonyl-CoA mutase family protein [Pararhizobium haloflavum]|uniref:methylmalonyl-CoA mutase family protein n=1 Tax=Pararhizobium haloflavum TaxID=2037914 RepID=UPI000C1997E0|nr:methylmalonyl-CoA mutase family protein [Pararhizobium haloflavum]
MKADLLDNTTFAPASEADWRALVDKALKGASFDQTLVSTSDDGIRYGPIAARRADGVVHARSQPESPWTVSQRVDDPQRERAAAQLSADIEGGASGVDICLSGASSAYGFGTPVGDIDAHLQSAASVREVRFETAMSTFADVVAAMESAGDAFDAHIDFGFPLHENGHADASSDVTRAFDLDIACTVLRADGRVAHNAGASEAQELAFALAAAAEGLRLAEKCGIDPESALAATEFALAADQDQFLTIAKFRAMRRLHAHMLDAVGIGEPFAAHLHAETSFRMLTRRDPETNILRNTIAVFAAGVAGADSISVLPHTMGLGLPDRFARRIARNTQTVLIDESHLAHVLDPAAGAGGIEQLSEALAERAWDMFRQVESEGGLLRSIADGAMTARIAQMRRERDEAIASGQRTMIGTTLYRAANERAVSLLQERNAAAVSASQTGLAPIQLDEAFAKENAA